ncbi:hypothetical protein D9M70_552650 [compost metagenome]
MHQCKLGQNNKNTQCIDKEIPVKDINGFVGEEYPWQVKISHEQPQYQERQPHPQTCSKIFMIVRQFNGLHINGIPYQKYPQNNQYYNDRSNLKAQITKRFFYMGIKDRSTVE